MDQKMAVEMFRMLVPRSSTSSPISDFLNFIPACRTFKATQLAYMSIFIPRTTILVEVSVQIILGAKLWNR